MKVFIFIAIVVIAATGIVANPVSSSGSSSSSSSNKQEVESDAQTQAQAQAQAQAQSTAEINRSRKSAYGGGFAPNIAAPPCAKNYMFSCQPSMAPAPCAPPHTSSYGSQASYSAPVPTYTMPVHGSQGSVVPQMYAGSGYLTPQGLNNHPSANQYYQY